MPALTSHKRQQTCSMPVEAGAPGDREGLHPIHLHTCLAGWPTHAHKCHMTHSRRTLITIKHTPILTIRTPLRYTVHRQNTGKRGSGRIPGGPLGQGEAGGLGAHPACTYELVFHTTPPLVPFVLPLLCRAPHSYQTPCSGARGGGEGHLPCGLLAICWQP